MNSTGDKLREFIKQKGRKMKQLDLRSEEGFRFEDDVLSRIRSKVLSDKREE